MFRAEHAMTAIPTAISNVPNVTLISQKWLDEPLVLISSENN